MKLPAKFYQRKTETVAKELLGKTLVHVVNGKRLAGKIVEVEAYLGIKDRAAHTYGDRRTKRTEAMYKAGGHAYVYFIYGMYDCINAVAEKEGVPEAVLIRALEPIEGIEQMKKNRKLTQLNKLCNGPGKLCQALKIVSKQSGQSLESAKLFIEDAPEISRAEIVAKPRIGVDYAKAHAKWPLRFYISGNPHVSKLG